MFTKCAILKGLRISRFFAPACVADRDLAARETEDIDLEMGKTAGIGENKYRW